MIELKPATENDKQFWLSLDSHITDEMWNNRIELKTGFIIICEGERIGVAAFNLFWDNLPFLSLIKILPEYRRRGYGRESMVVLENMLKANGFTALLLSTQTDEEAQHFYRRIGYKECGCLMLNDERLNQPMEMFFIKYL